MRAKLKIILTTFVCTTLGWAGLIAGALYFWPQGGGQVPMGTFYFCPPTRGPVAIMAWLQAGDPAAVEWEPNKGVYLARLISSNTANSATSVLYSYTSHPPERLRFQTLLIESPTNK